MIEDVGEEPGYLPLLQFALLRLWGEREGMQLTHQGYERIGGVQRALAGYADSVLARFTDEEQSHIRRIFMQLVRPSSRSGEADTRQIVTREQITDWTLVTALADVRLVVTRQRDGQDTVEVAHEALIQHWQTLRGWLNEDRLALRLLTDVRHQAQEWEAAERAASHLPRWNAKLEQTEELLGNPRFGATALELGFLRACRELKEKEEREEREKQRKLQMRLRWAAGVSLVALAAMVFAGLKYQESEDKNQLALFNQSRFLADQARQLTEKGKIFSAMRVALEALPNTSESHSQRPFLNEAQLQLYNAVENNWEGVLEHEGIVNGSVFSPDGKFLLTWSGIKAYLWHVQQQRIAHLYQVDTDSLNKGISHAAFSPDSKTFVTVGYNLKLAKLWDTYTQGNRIKNF